VKDILRELYGAGIIFFYYLKYPILIGWPLLRYGLDYPDNLIMDLLWVYCLLLVLKDIVYLFILKSDRDRNGPSSSSK
jgi:hypothetical protein